MKELIQAAEDIGFNGGGYLPIHHPNPKGGNSIVKFKDDTQFYLWMCQLHRWMRREHRTSVEPFYIDSWESCGFTIYTDDLFMPFCQIGDSGDKSYLSIEDSLEQGLIEACKYVKQSLIIEN